MKTTTARNFLFALIFLLIGVTAGWTGKIYFDNRDKSITRLPSTSDSFYKDFFNDDFFGQSRDPFTEMRRMESQILKEFGDSSLHVLVGGGNRSLNYNCCDIIIFSFSKSFTQNKFRSLSNNLIWILNQRFHFFY